MINEYDIRDMSEDSIVFECKYSNPKLNTRMEMSAHSHITEVIEQFERFLRGVGYFPPSGCHLDFVDDYTYTMDWTDANE